MISLLDFVNATLRSEFTQPFNKSSRDKLTFNKDTNDKRHWIIMKYESIQKRKNVRNHLKDKWLEKKAIYQKSP